MHSHQGWLQCFLSGILLYKSRESMNIRWGGGGAVKGHPSKTSDPMEEGQPKSDDDGRGGGGLAPKMDVHL